jgi:hypothetical protein
MELELIFLRFSLVYHVLVITPSRLHTHLLPLSEFCDNPNQAAHYHILIH